MNDPHDIQLNDWLTDRMTHPKFQTEWEASAPAYQITRLRIMRGLTQSQLAKLVTFGASYPMGRDGKVTIKPER